MNEPSGDILATAPASRLSLPARFGVVALLAVFLAQSAAFVSTTSFTYDETRYAAVGKHLLAGPPWTVDVATSLHPPLAFYLSSLGLVGIDVPDWIWQDPDAAERGKQVVLAVGERIVYRSRLPMLVLGVVLGMTLFSWSRQCWGTPGAFLSLFLFAFSPNLIAHQSLITPDFAVTAFLFLAAWCFDQLCRGWQFKWSLATGLAVGLALLSKFTALFLVPLTVLWMVAAVLVGRDQGWKWKTATRHLALVWAVVGFVVLVGYQFQPMLFLKGIRYQLAVSQGEWTGYLMGEVSKDGWLYYFLIALLVKVPVPALVFSAVALVVRFRRKHGLDATTEVILLSTVGLFFVYLSLFNRLNIGLRYLLPAFPFMLVWVGQAAQSFLVPKLPLGDSESSRSGTPCLTPGATRASGTGCLTCTTAGSLGGRLKCVVFAALVMWQVVSVGRVAPHYLAYFNEIAGGPENGHRWLGDSNLDWGQDLKGLAQYVERHDLDSVCVRYFGTMPPELYGLKPCGDEPLEEGTIQAVSVSLLQGLYHDAPKRFEHLRAEEPIATIGYTIRLYRTQRAK